MNPYLSACQITKSFRVDRVQVKVLENLDFEIMQGEFVTVIGSSGCGKSTLLELFAGVTVPDSGHIYLQGKEITGQSGYLGYMPQDDLLFPWLNSTDNALIPVRVKGLPLKDAKERIAELLPIFGLEKHAKLLPYQLSGGLRQRVALLRTYMTGSKLLLLDEPMASLDALTRLQMQEWLKDICQKLQLSVILVTHDISEAIKLSDRIELMCTSPGSLCKSFAVCNEIKTNPTLAEELRLEIIGLLGIKDSEK